MKIITKKKIIKYLTIFLIILSLILIFNLILTNFSKPQLKISDLSYLIKKINFDNSEYNKKINNIFIHKNGETDELILIQNIK